MPLFKLPSGEKIPLLPSRAQLESWRLDLSRRPSDSVNSSSTLCSADFDVTTAKMRPILTGSASEAPEIASLGTFLPINMSDFETSAPPDPPPASHYQTNGHADTNGAFRDDSPPSGTNTPRRISRIVSSSVATRMPPGALDTSPQPPISRTPGSENGGDASPFINAIGGASLAGKTGRVVERLMAEIDRNRRALNVEVQKRQDVERREQAQINTIDVLRDENENLKQAQEVDATRLKRRERQLEEMKSDLQTEKGRRSRAEQATKDANYQRDEIQEQCRRETSEAAEKEKQSSKHAEVLQQSHHQLRTEYSQRVETLRNDLRKVNEERDTERQTAKRLEVVVEALTRETEKALRLHAELNSAFINYKQERDAEVDHLKRKILAGEASRQEAERVAGEARHLMVLVKNNMDRESRK